MKDLFTPVAEDYLKYHPGYPEEFFDWIAGLSCEKKLSWDCACGSGQATVGLSKRFERVFATDLSEAQLENAPKLGNVEWRVASAYESGLPDGGVNLIAVGQALHWFDLENSGRSARGF